MRFAFIKCLSLAARDGAAKILSPLHAALRGYSFSLVPPLSCIPLRLDHSHRWKLFVFRRRLETQRRQASTASVRLPISSLVGGVAALWP